MRKVIGKDELEWRRIALGVAVGGVVMAVMTGMGAWLLERELAGVEWVNYLAALILLVSSFAGAKTAGASRERWVGSVLVGLGLWLLLALIHLTGFEGGLRGSGATALAILGGTGAAVLLGGGGKRTPKRFRKYRNR